MDQTQDEWEYERESNEGNHKIETRVTHKESNGPGSESNSTTIRDARESTDEKQARYCKGMQAWTFGWEPKCGAESDKKTEI